MFEQTYSKSPKKSDASIIDMEEYIIIGGCINVMMNFLKCPTELFSSYFQLLLNFPEAGRQPSRGAHLWEGKGIAFEHCTHLTARIGLIAALENTIHDNPTGTEHVGNRKLKAIIHLPNALTQKAASLFPMLLDPVMMGG